MSYIEKSRVLGIETYRETGKFVTNLMSSSYSNEITTHDLTIIWTAVALTITMVLWQILLIIWSWRKERKFDFWKIVRYLILDVLAFVMMIVVMVTINYHILKIGEPHNIEAERIGESLVRVRWETYDPQVGVMLWGYDREYVDTIDLGNGGGESTRVHDVLLEIEPQREVYYYLVMKGKKYGQSNDEPYKIEVERGYKLEKIETNE